ncbi:MAG: alpha/beta fold hydrolase [Candidatus Thorarchaeota archaeon]
MLEGYIEPSISFISTTEGSIEFFTITSNQFSKSPKNKQKEKIILLVPGAFHNAELMYDLQIRICEIFTRKFKNNEIIVHSFSQPGHGKSELKGCLHLKSFNAYVKVLDEIVKHINKEVILVGHSLGGLVIEKYLEKHTSSAAALIGPFNHSWSFVKDVSKHLLKHQKRTILFFIFTWSPKRSFNQSSFKRLFYSINDGTHEFNNKIILLMEKISDESLRGLLGAFTKIIHYKKISRIPILIIGGENDVAVRKEGLEWLGKKLNARIEMIANASHNSLIDDELIGIQPEDGNVLAVADCISDFIGDVTNNEET